MKKLAIAVLAIVVLALLALPWVYGRLTQSLIEARVADINGGVWSAEIKSYERGWLRSHAVIDLGLGPTYAAADPAEMPLGGHLPIALDIAHGPIGLLDGLYFGWSKVRVRPDHTSPQVADLEQRLGVPYLFEFRSRTAFLGGTSFDAEVPKFEVPNEIATVQFSGAALAGTLRGNHLKSDAHIDSIEASSPFGGAALHGLRAAIDTELLPHAVVLGTTGVEIDSVSATDQQLGADLFDAAQIKVGQKITLDPSGARLDLLTTYDMASMTVEGVKLTDASLGLTLRNVDLAAFQAYQAAAEEVARTQDLSVLQPAVARLFATKPTLVLEPVRVLADGELFEARLELTPNDRAATDPDVLADPLGLAAALDGSAQVDVSRRLAERIAQQVMRMQLATDPAIPPDQLEQMVAAQSGMVLLMLAGQGILEASGTGYRAKVELAGGALTLNGRPMPLPVP